MIAKAMEPFVFGDPGIGGMFDVVAKMVEEYGEENVYNFSIGNPNVPAPKALTEKLKELLGGEYDISFVTVSEPLCEALEGRLTERLIPIQIRIRYPWMEDVEAPNE